MYLGVGWKSQFVGNLSNAFNDIIGFIKLWYKFIVDFVFEGYLFIGLKAKKRVILYEK